VYLGDIVQSRGWRDFGGGKGVEKTLDRENKIDPYMICPEIVVHSLIAVRGQRGGGSVPPQISSQSMEMASTSPLSSLIDKPLCEQ
jgi:hypothetical protein